MADIYIPNFRREAASTSPLESLISGLTQGAEKGMAYSRQARLDKEESEMNKLKKALLASQAYKNYQAEPKPNPVETATDKEQAKVDIQEKEDLRNEVPLMIDQLKDVTRAMELVTKNKDLFHPGVGGTDYFSGERAARLSKKPDAGELQKLFLDIVARGSKNISSKGLASVFNAVMKNKAHFGEEPEKAYGKLKSIYDELKRALKNEEERYSHKYKRPLFGDILPQEYGKYSELQAAPLKGEEAKETITLRNKKTGVTEKVTIEEARRRGVPNV